MNKALMMTTILNSKQYWQRVKSLMGPIGMYPMLEASGTSMIDKSGNARHGTYTGVELQNAAAPGGGKCPLFDGTNDYALLPAGFNTAVSGIAGVAGTILIWVKSAIWADGSNRTPFAIYADGNNYIDILKLGSTTYLRYKAGGTSKQVDINFTSSVFFPIILEWSKASDYFKAWRGVNGTPTQIGGTQSSLGTWSGGVTRSVVGALSDTPGNPFLGNIAMFAVGPNQLTLAQKAALIKV